MTYPNGTTIEVVRHGNILRGRVVAYTNHIRALYRIACVGGYIYSTASAWACSTCVW